MQGSATMIPILTCERVSPQFFKLLQTYAVCPQLVSKEVAETAFRKTLRERKFTQHRLLSLSKNRGSGARLNHVVDRGLRRVCTLTMRFMPQTMCATAKIAACASPPPEELLGRLWQVPTEVVKAVSRLWEGRECKILGMRGYFPVTLKLAEIRHHVQ